MTYIPESLRGKPLSSTEIEVLTAIRAGLTDKQTAARLCMAESTVRTHVRRMQKKLDANTRAHMIAIGFEKGYLRLTPETLKAPARPLQAVTHLGRAA